ncbi:MAG: sulfatase, partial [Bacteroidota bacterium]
MTRVFSITDRGVFKVVLTFVSIVLFTIPTLLGQTDKKPNVLIIMADDLTYLDLPIYGGQNIATPNIDAFRRQGLKFNKAFVSMAMCTPSRSELLTGKYPLSNGAMFNHTRTKEGTKSMVHYLEGLGYRVGIAGKTHIKPKSAYPFEYIEGIEGSAVAKTAGCNLSEVEKFMAKVAPFCLITALTSPHAPWTVGEPEKIDLEGLVLPPNMADTKITRESYRRYLAEIMVFDEQVGSILDALDKTGKANNTLVLLTTEQGAQFPFNKWTNFNAGIHTGIVIRWPGKVVPNSETDALVQYADVLPTLIEACGGEITEKNGFDGSSFLDVLRGKAKTHRKYAYALHHNDAFR